jgi:glycerol uptake facilitator protein
MTPFVSELTGTALLILLGDGVVANVVLNKTYGNNSGLIVITFGWAMGVFVGVYVSATASGGHLNPAVTIGLAALGKFDWAKVPLYVTAQLLGAMIGSFLVWITYRKHFEATPDTGAKLAVFCTSPAIPGTIDNLLSEIIGTFVLVLGALFLVASKNSLGSLDALPVAFLVLAIGVSLGGTTGYAINPARDLGPRIMPIAGPILGSLLAALCYSLIH